MLKSKANSDSAHVEYILYAQVLPSIFSGTMKCARVCNGSLAYLCEEMHSGVGTNTI